MQSAPYPDFLRRRLVLSTGLLFFGLGAAAPASASTRPGSIVTILGDSITAGYGLPRAQAMPAQLQRLLEARGARARIRAAGVSGDTTAAGLARVGFSVQDDTALCLVALGGNDLLRGVPPAITRRNLAQIVDSLKTRKIRVVLAGLRPPPSAGLGLSGEFQAAFRYVAQSRSVPLVPDMLAGVAGVRGLNQPDGIHPNAQGARRVAENLAPAIIRALGAPAGKAVR